MTAHRTATALAVALTVLGTGGATAYAVNLPEPARNSPSQAPLHNPQLIQPGTQVADPLTTDDGQPIILRTGNTWTADEDGATYVTAGSTWTSTTGGFVIRPAGSAWK